MTYRFNVVPINILTDYFEEADKLILKYIWKIKGQKISKKLLRGDMPYQISKLITRSRKEAAAVSA